MDRFCCYLEGGKADGRPCDKPAEYEIIDNGEQNPSEGRTDSCLEHIPELLTDAQVHTLVRI